MNVWPKVSPLPVARMTAGSSSTWPGATDTIVAFSTRLQASALIRSKGTSTEPSRGSALSTVNTDIAPGSGSWSWVSVPASVPSPVARPRSRRSGVNRHSSSRPVSAGKSATLNERSACDLVFGGATVGVLMLSFFSDDDPGRPAAVGG